MSFEISNREGIRYFTYILKSLVRNAEKAIMIFQPTEIFLLQHYDLMEGFASERLSIMYSFQNNFFSKTFYPNLKKSKCLAFEVDISKIYKKLCAIRKMIDSFSFDIPVFVEKKDEFLEEIERYPNFSAVIKYDSFEKFTCRQRIDCEYDPSIDFKGVLGCKSYLNNKKEFIKVLEFKKENMANLNVFKNVYLDIIMNPEYIICKQADIPMNFTISFKKSRLTDDYDSNYILTKHFGGFNKLQMHTNKLLNYMQLCKALSKNPSISLSQISTEVGNRRINMPILGNNFAGYYSHVGLLIDCEENENPGKNPFDSNQNSFIQENEIEEENEENNEQNSENQRNSPNRSISEGDLDEIDYALEKLQCESEKPENLLSKINPKSNNAISYFGFISEENEEEFKDKEKEFKTRANDLISKLNKRKDYEDPDLENYERKKKKLNPIRNEFSLNLDLNENINEKKKFDQISKSSNFNEENNALKEKTHENLPFTKDPNYILKNKKFF